MAPNSPTCVFPELRERRPIFETPAFSLVSRYHDVMSVLERSAQFSVRLYGAKMDEVVGPFMLGRDQAVQNYRDKSLMRVAMPLSDLPSVRVMVREATQKLLPTGAGQVDIIKAVCRPVPIELCGSYFGYTGPDIESMLRWSKTAQSDFFKNLTNDPAVHAAAVAAGTEFKEYLAGFVRERSEAIQTDPAAARPTVADRLIQMSRESGLGFDTDAMIANLAGLLIGAVETTSQAVAHAVEQILLRPPVAARAVAAAQAGPEGDGELAGLVWEALRLNPINPLLFRFTETDTLLGEGSAHARTISAGTVVLACTASAMWDDTVVERADDFRPNRPSFCYLHFGPVDHECLGRQVAEVMVPEMIRVLLLRNASLIPGEAGAIDLQGGPFPESFVVHLDAH